jgi:Fe-S-cluster containining protein
MRPEQCRRFPFWEYFKTHREQLVRECPGIRERSDSVMRVKSEQ